MLPKILIVEDDQIMNRMYRNLFLLNGFGVEVAHDGEEGLEKALSLIPDLIILDVMMPKMNGLELLDRLKADETTKDILVVLLTNLGVIPELEKAVQRGAVGYITKSDHDPERVFQIVKQILGNIGKKM